MVSFLFLEFWFKLGRNIVTNFTPNLTTCTCLITRFKFRVEAQNASWLNARTATCNRITHELYGTVCSTYFASLAGNSMTFIRDWRAFSIDYLIKTSS